MGHYRWIVSENRRRYTCSQRYCSRTLGSSGQYDPTEAGTCPYVGPRMKVISSPYFVETTVFSELAEISKLTRRIGFRLSIVSDLDFHVNGHISNSNGAFLSLSSDGEI